MKIPSFGFVIASSLLGLSLSACSLVGLRTTEEPPFKVVLSVGNEFEVRKYDQMVWAEVVEDEKANELVEVGGENENRNFRSLFKYITGDNEAKTNAAESQKIPMTAPVFMSPDRKSMSFVLPEDMRIDEAPTPTNERVSLREIPSKLVASLRFSGTLAPETIEEKSKELRSALDETDYRPIGEVLVAGYDPPWTVPGLRRNEVLVEVEKLTDQGIKKATQ